MSIKNTNELNKADFNLSTNKGTIRRGFFSLADFNRILSGADNKYHFVIKQSTIDNFNKWVANKKIDCVFMREKAIVFAMSSADKKLYKFNTNVFYADKVAQDNPDWDLVVVDNINDLSIMRNTNTNTFAEKHGFNIK